MGQALVAAWAPHVQGINLEKYAAAAVAPLLTEDPDDYEQLRRSIRIREPRLTENNLCVIDEREERDGADLRLQRRKYELRSKDCDHVSVADQSTAVPDDTESSCNFADLDDHSF